MKSFYDSALNALFQAVGQYQDPTEASKALGVNYQTLHSWIRKNNPRKPSLKSLAVILDNIGATVHLPGKDTCKDICFVNAKIVPGDGHSQPPASETYIAAPLVGEVGAGPGYLPEDTVRSWFLVYKHHSAIRHRRNLIAVEIASDSLSMAPTLNPGDIVLIDRDDKDVSKPGRMMLVLDPVDGSGRIKRVGVKHVMDDFQVTFYSDNATEYPPEVYSLNHHFYGDWNRAIFGRAIWAWADIREK